MNGTPTANGPRPLRIVLREGFRGHTVVIAVDGLEVYRRVGVTTDRGRARADAFDVTAASAVARIAVSMTPGDIAAAMDFDVARHSHVAISLVGEGTVGFETSPGWTGVVIPSRRGCWLDAHERRSKARHPLGALPRSRGRP